MSRVHRGLKLTTCDLQAPDRTEGRNGHSDNIEEAVDEGRIATISSESLQGPLQESPPPPLR